MISYGIESIDTNILKTVKKNISYEQIREAIRLTRQNNIMAVGHIILGLPGETVDSANKTVATVKGLGLDLAQFYCAVPFPGSDLFDTALAKGWITGQDFEDFRQEKAVMSLPTISPLEVERIKKQAIMGFYGRVSVVKTLLRLIRLRTLFRAASASFKFLKGVVYK